MPLTAPLANLSVYYAMCLPRREAEWTDTTTAEYLPRTYLQQNKSSEVWMEEKLENYSKCFQRPSRIQLYRGLQAHEPPLRIKPSTPPHRKPLGSLLSLLSAASKTRFNYMWLINYSHPWSLLHHCMCWYVHYYKGMVNAKFESDRDQMGAAWLIKGI